MSYKVSYKDNEVAIVTNEINGSNYVLEPIFTNSELGTFYIFKSLLNMPYKRMCMYDILKQMEVIGINKDELESKLKEIKDLIVEKEKGFLEKIYSHIDFLEQTSKSFWDYKNTILMLIGLTIVHEDDLTNIGNFEQSIIQKNIKEWENYPAMFEVFFYQVDKKTNTFWNTVDIDLKYYSELIAKTEQKNQKEKSLESESKQPNTISRIFKNLFS